MPLVQAFPLGLPLHGTTTVTFADGQNQVKLLAGAKVSVGTKTKEEFGLIILEETSTDILVGMDFLLTFKLALSRVSWRSDYLMKMRSRR
jgi:predicted aspartyl protease